MSKNFSYRIDIDGLRAVAVLSVIFYHAKFQFFSGGYLGVDVFFVISGYLITSIILKDVRENKFSYVDFYFRRAKRILPAFFLIVIVSFPIFYVFLGEEEFKFFSKSVTWSSLFGANIFFWNEVDYFSPNVDEIPFLHMWSLAVEEQFYLLYPTALLLVFRFAPRKAAQTFLIIASASLILAEWASTRYSVANFFLLPTRAWELIAGALCALKALEFSKKYLIEFTGLLGIFLIVISVVLFDDKTPTPSFITMIPVIGACLIIQVGQYSRFVGLILGNYAMVTLGLISYSAYLWHQPIFAFARINELDGELDLNKSIVLIFSTLVAAYVTYRFVETPFRRISLNDIEIKIKYVLAAGLTAISIAVLGVSAASISDLSSRAIFSERQIRYSESAKASPFREDCHTSGTDYLKPHAACNYFSSDIKVAVFGDSYAVELAYALAESLEKKDIGVKHLSFSACRPNNEVSSSCQSWIDEAVQYLIDEESITHVFLTYHIIPILNESKSRKAVLGKLQEVVSRLSVEKKVFYVMQAPELPGHISKYIMGTDFDNKGRIVGETRSAWNSRYLGPKLVLEKYLEDAELIDLTSIFCDSKFCYGSKDGQALYYDTNHISIFGASLMADVLVDDFL